MSAGIEVAVRALTDEEILLELPAYQRSVIEEMISTRTPAEAAMHWLENSGQADTAAFGGVKSTGERLFRNTLLELQKLLCTTEGYDQERQQIVSATGAGKLFAASSISAFLAPHIGVAAVVLTPVVVLIFVMISRSSQLTVCEILTEFLDDLSLGGGPAC